MNGITAPGTYVLVLQVTDPISIEVGRLGTWWFDRGWYLYVGSALSGLGPRLARHLRSRKRCHWHIDYLLGQASVREVWYSLGTQRRECEWARASGSMPGVKPFLAAFGASDCRCHTHLFQSEMPPRADAFRSYLGEGLDLRVIRVGFTDSA